MTEQGKKQDVGPLWAARLVVILIVAVVLGAAIALYVVARGPR